MAKSRPVDTNEQIAPLVQAAIAQWLMAGAAPEELRTALENVEVRVVDLPGPQLGQFLPGVILIDVDAAGYGWFVDSTPWRSAEFSLRIAPSERQAVGDSPAFGHVDLLTVLTHEIGHAIGRDDLTAKRQAHNIMAETIGLGTRRRPVAGDDAQASDTDAQRRREAAKEALFARLTTDEALFSRTGRISFATLRSARHRDWISGVEEFFATGDLATERW